MIFNKLIRDKIPEILEKKWVKFKSHKANDSEYFQKLKEKLVEEVNEFLQDNNSEEIADILEVIDAICIYQNFPKIEIEQVQKQKAEKNWKFLERIILEETD